MDKYHLCPLTQKLAFYSCSSMNCYASKLLIESTGVSAVSKTLREDVKVRAGANKLYGGHF